MKEDLFVIGSVNADLSITTIRFPQKGETINGEDFHLTLGGKGANQAFYTSQLGISTMMFCSLGKDYFGQFVLEALNKTSIVLKPHFSQAQTGKAFVFLSENDNRIILDQGANYDFN
jgi:ribokinase